MGQFLDSVQTSLIRTEAIRMGWKPSEFLLGAIRLKDSNAGDGFDDILWSLNDKGIWYYKGTTKCGTYGTANPVSYNGVTGGAWVVPGFYEDVYELGIHAPSNPAFKHKAWLQRGSLKFRRDTNRDGDIDIGEPEQTGCDTAINYHRASAQRDELHVGRYGIACMVGQNHNDHEFAVDRWEQTEAYKADPKARVSLFLLSKAEYDALGLSL